MEYISNIMYTFNSTDIEIFTSKLLIIKMLSTRTNFLILILIKKKTHSNRLINYHKCVYKNLFLYVEYTEIVNVVILQVFSTRGAICWRTLELQS